MPTYETRAVVPEDRSVTVQLPADFPTGEHRLLITIQPEPEGAPDREPLDFPVDSYGPWPDDLSMRREDRYDVRGR